MDITKISIDALKKDKEASLQDIITCETALGFGVCQYSGGSVRERLNVNKEIVEKIDKELLRRKNNEK